jgi:hypothetical protein
MDRKSNNRLNNESGRKREEKKRRSRATPFYGVRIQNNSIKERAKEEKGQQAGYK